MSAQDEATKSGSRDKEAIDCLPMSNTSADIESQDIAITELMNNTEETLHRHLKARHVSMIAIGGSVGTGLIIGSGSVLASAGPGSLFISFLLAGIDVYVVMTAVGEMASYLPHQSGFSGYADRFVDRALGFALGWCYFLKYFLAIPNQLTASALIIQEWLPASRVNPGVWIAVFLILVATLNYFGVKVFGEVEYWLSMFKIITFVGLILVCFILALGGGPNHQRTGFWYWQEPGAFRTYKSMPDGPTGRFVAFWSSMVTAVFAYLGTELVGVTVGETAEPHKSMPKAVRLTFYRIFGFYCLSVLLLGMCLPYNSPELALANNAATGAAASPFTAAIRVAGIQVLPTILNVCILVFVLGTANSDIYIVSRTLYGLSKRGHAPRFFQYTDSRGVPIWGLLCAVCGGLLGFMNVSTSSKTVFSYFVNLVTIFGMLSWACLLYTHIRFVRARQQQKINKSALPYTAPLGLWGTYIAFSFTMLVILTKNFTVFIPSPTTYGNFDYVNFITGYIGIPVFLAMFFGFKIWKNTKVVPLMEVDLATGAMNISVLDRDTKSMWSRWKDSLRKAYHM